MPHDAQGSEAQYEHLDELNGCLVIESSEVWGTLSL